jgi:nucleotide-binding universal stress UspA family protein
MKTILVATDFSIAAQNASKYAAEMALAIHADLLLLHVYQLPISYTEVPFVVNMEDVLKGAREEITRHKEELIQKTSGKINIETEVREGVFFNELNTLCKNVMPYAVVMGSQGTTATERFLYGGHTVNAMQHLMWPLITVPIDATYAGVKKIGLACDFNEVVDTTPIDEIKLLIHDFDAELHVLNTGKEKVFDPDIIFESGVLEEMVGELKPRYHFITNSNTDEGIMDFAIENRIDLLIILPKRHGFLEALLHKSHTKQLVLHSHVPVMALHMQ